MEIKALIDKAEILKNKKEQNVSSLKLNLNFVLFLY